MAKDTFYFQHDYNARFDNKVQLLIIDYGGLGYGIYWAIVELLHETESHTIELNDFFYKPFSKQMSTDVEQVMNICKSCIQYGLFKTNNEGFLYCDRVDQNIRNRELISESKSKAGKASALKRALNKNISTDVEQPLTRVQQNPTKERKGKEIKVNEIKENKTYTIAERKLKFADSLRPFLNLYGKDMLNDFYDYWTEHGLNDKKMRFEKEKSFGIERRLITWKSRTKNDKKQVGTIETILQKINLTDEQRNTFINPVEVDK